MYIYIYPVGYAEYSRVPKLPPEVQLCIYIYYIIYMILYYLYRCKWFNAGSSLYYVVPLKEKSCTVSHTNMNMWYVLLCVVMALPFFGGLFLLHKTKNVPTTNVINWQLPHLSRGARLPKRFAWELLMWSLSRAQPVSSHWHCSFSWWHFSWLNSKPFLLNIIWDSH